MTVLQETKSIEAGMGRLIRALKGKTWVVIPVVMIFFSLCGSVFGMAEETIPFIPIFVSLMIAAGYDSITGAGMRRRRRLCRSFHQSVHYPGSSGYRAGRAAVRYDVPYSNVRMLVTAHHIVHAEICRQGKEEPNFVHYA